jgi:hypothetical protein
MLTLKLKDEVLTALGLTKEATPEQAEEAITKTIAGLKDSAAMNELTIEVVDKLAMRVEALQKAPKAAELPKDFEANVKAIAETAAKATAAQEVSAAIAKAGTVGSSAQQTAEDTKPEPTIREQFAAIKDSTARGEFWNAHRDELMKSL